MARLLQQLLSPLEPILPHGAQQAASTRDDDVALGCECADPSLQFEGWEPLPLSEAGAIPAR